MEFSAPTQGERLSLYHLAQAFAPDADRAELRAEGRAAVVTMEKGGRILTERTPYPADETEKHGRAAAAGLAFAKAALAFGGETPPYGTLTGVRPVKVALRLLSAGKSPAEAVRLLTERYLVSPEKAALLTDLARIEEREARPAEVMLYVSIPFCPTRCRYCSFISSAAPRHLAMIPDYLRLLETDLALAGGAVRAAGKSVSAVYVGGGTPGILTAPQLERLLKTVRAAVPLEPGAEVTVEIGRPDTVTAEKLSVLESEGVGRVCVNPQSTRDDVLALAGRSHTAADFFRAVEEAKKHPFTINCDLIAGLAGDDAAGFLRSVGDVIALGVENLTIHALCRKKSAAGRADDAGFPGIRDAVAEAHRLCIENGLLPYYLYRQKMAAAGLENLGFAKEGRLCRYNLCMMEDLASIAACGAGAIGKTVRGGEAPIRRFPQPKYPFEYLAAPERIVALHGAFQKALEELP